MGLGTGAEGEGEEGGDHGSPELAAQHHGEAHGPDVPPDLLAVRPVLDQRRYLLQIWHRSPIQGIIATAIEKKTTKRIELVFRVAVCLRWRVEEAVAEETELEGAAATTAAAWAPSSPRLDSSF